MPQLIFEYHHVGVVKYASEYLFYVKRRVLSSLLAHAKNDKDHQEHMERFYLDAALKHQAQKIHDTYFPMVVIVHLSQQPIS